MFTAPFSLPALTQDAIDKPAPFSASVRVWMLRLLLLLPLASTPWPPPPLFRLCGTVVSESGYGPAATRLTHNAAPTSSSHHCSVIGSSQVTVLPLLALPKTLHHPRPSLITLALYMWVGVGLIRSTCASSPPATHLRVGHR